MKNLRDAMQNLIEDMKEQIRVAKAVMFSGDLHRHICCWVASRYNLWDEQDMFPVWLSRVVEGVIRDEEEKGGA